MSWTVGTSAAPEDDMLREVPCEDTEAGGGWVGGVPKDVFHWLKGLSVGRHGVQCWKEGMYSNMRDGFHVGALAKGRPCCIAEAWLPWFPVIITIDCTSDPSVFMSPGPAEIGGEIGCPP